MDNALDACEEAGVLPDLFIGIRKVSEEVYRITVEDNGPGIVPAQVPFVFGKLLYGSRFHQVRQSRGQQGIGISAAVLYAQLTTGLPTVVISRTDPKEAAHRFELTIHVESNEPHIVSKKEIDWDRTHGTRVEIELRTSLTARKRLLEYLKFTSVVNPHARIMVEIDGEMLTFERVSAEPIASPKAIQPHPHGIELGALKRMTGASADSLGEFLVTSFSRVGKKAAAEIGAVADLEAGRKVKALSADELKRLHTAMQSVDVPAPPAAQCLSPIGEDLVRQGLDKEFQLDFVKARTRPPSVYGGHPFVVEAAIGYGGRLPAEDRAQILRFANRVPLMYQQGACAITQSVSEVNWKQYGIGQQGLPMGPVLILVHVASTNVPFTSESKDAIAAIPEISREIDLVLKDLGRELKQFLSRRDRRKAQDDRARAICSIIPEIAAKVSEIVEKPLIDVSPIEGKIMRRVVAKKWTADGMVHLSLRNYTPQEVTLTLYDLSPDEGKGADPLPSYTDRAGDDFTRVWQVKLLPDKGWDARYRGKGGGRIELRGVEDTQKVVVDLDV